MKIIKEKPLHHYYSEGEKISFIEKFILRKNGVQDGTYQRMFNEDFSNFFRAYGRTKSKKFNVDSNDEALTKRLLSNIGDQYRHLSQDERIRMWIEKTAQHLLHSSTAYYFIYDVNNKEELNIVPLSSHDIFRIFNTRIQFIPKRFKNHWENDGELLPRELRILDTNKLIRFYMCRSIKRLLSHQNRMLHRLEKYRHNSLAFYPQATYEKPNPKNDFDFNYWSETQNNALHLATHDTGWNCRHLGSSERSVYFDYYRMIRFKKNQLIFRDNILFQLSKELTRIGRQYNEAFSVVISPTNALPRIEKLNELEDQLSQENVSFTKIMDYYFEK
ncbi:hypothetical protein [Vibrio scophthalmi]|uniref:Uncharacterized protein n=1 Tax=Vibrio scophthalmi TaxID=45658 RepID=A0A1E3WHQ2_9VIBR|nr:hypothetical protein [Vibrio scophthalmi]ODS05052.1 hypothetical protein VSF3289_04192 [Vibrio scophthalmi]